MSEHISNPGSFNEFVARADTGYYLSETDLIAGYSRSLATYQASLAESRGVASHKLYEKPSIDLNEGVPSGIDTV